MQSTFVNIQINVPTDEEFREKLIECAAKCFKYDYDIKNGWYYVDIDTWSIHLLNSSKKSPNNWVDIEYFVDISSSLSLQDEINLLEDYFSFNIYEKWLQSNTNTENLEDNWEQDSTVQKAIVDYYKEVFAKDWEEIEKQQEEIVEWYTSICTYKRKFAREWEEIEQQQEIRKKFIEGHIHEQINLEIEAL